MTARATLCLALLSLISTPGATQTLRAFDFPSERLDTLPSDEVRIVTGEYEVYADGNVKDIVGSAADATTASGSLGLGYSSGGVVVNALVNAVGTATPLTENFGSALLAPASGTSLNAGVVDARIRLLELGNSSVGIHGYGSVSSAKWQVDTAGTTFGVVTPGLGLGIFCQVLNVQVPPTGDEVVGRSLAAVIDLGLAVRGIAGDIAQTSNDEVRHAILGERKQRTWAGFEGGITIQLNGLKAGLTLYAFPKDVPGLSDGQVTAGFSVQSSLLSGKVSRPAKNADILRVTQEQEGR